MNKEMSNSARDTAMEKGHAQRLDKNAALLEKIQKLSFVKCELELYLDTHPDCKVALDYYGQTVDALTQLMNKYQASGKPIVAQGSIETKRWSWVAEPWPWQTEEGVRK